jgi:hypothetical protein
MDRYSELELKFDAGDVPERTFLRVIADQFAGSVLRYKRVEGWDHYWRQGDSVVRHRCDGTRQTSVFTVKKRKSQGSLTDRHEVDLPLREDIKPEDAVRFLEMTGWRRWFSIDKCSYIFHIEDCYGALLCIALYDVTPIDGHGFLSGDTRRFLEIEIERESSCTPEIAKNRLDFYEEVLRKLFTLKGPLNQSLQEMFGPKDTQALLSEGLSRKVAEEQAHPHNVDCQFDVFTGWHCTSGCKAYSVALFHG